MIRPSLCLVLLSLILFDASAAGTRARVGANLYRSGTSTGAADTTGVGQGDYGTFAFRCAAPGVVVCQDFEASNITDNVSGLGGGYASGAYPSGQDGLVHATRDTSVKFEGSSSLRFDIRAGGGTIPFTTLPAGEWHQQFGPDGASTKFGDMSELHFQFSYRLDSAMLTHDWTTHSDQGWKLFIVFGPIPGSSCSAPQQFVQENSYQRNIMSAYTMCGSPPLTSTYTGTPPYDFEQGYYSCAYGSTYATEPTCMRYQSGVWITEYWIVHQDANLGTVGTHGTSWEAWASFDGGPYRKFIEIIDKAWGSNTNHGSNGTQEILLTPYFSGANNSTDNPATSIWYDSLIVSHKAILQPGGLVIPSTTGWFEVPDTWLYPCVIPTDDHCKAIFDAYSGGAIDKNRGRIIPYGGGHGDYSGNEVYAFDVVHGGRQRIVEQSPTLPYCSEGGTIWVHDDTTLATTVSRAHTATTATVVLSSTTNIVFDAFYSFSGISGDAAYNGSYKLTSVDTGTNTVTYDAAFSGTESTTSDTGGSVIQHQCDRGSDGKPAARHTYNQIVYVPDQGDGKDYIYLMGGSLAGQANGSVRMSRSIFKLDLTTNTWTDLYPNSGVDLPSPTEQHSCDYSESQHSIYCHGHDGYEYKYVISTNTIYQSTLARSGSGLQQNASIDQYHDYIYVFGGNKLFRAALGSATTPNRVDDVTSSTTGCSTALNSSYGGSAYDPVDHTIVIWNTGDTVYDLDPVTLICTAETYAHGPGAPAAIGTMGRFGYVPAIDAFAVLNNFRRNAFILKRR